MPRPPIERVVRGAPGAYYYKPRGIPLRTLQEVVLGLDEMEAMRLADLQGLDHQAVGHRMGVSRQTAGRILAAARQKVAEAIIGGKALRIGGGPIQGPSPPPGPPPWGRGQGPGRPQGRGRHGWRGG